jgi:hypothetical protein
MVPYAAELKNITQRLIAFTKSVGAKLLFAITSPMMAELKPDQDVCELNRRAAEVMAELNVDTVDLHAAIVGKCGAVPQASCFGHSNCFSPHCSPEGYEWLANSTLVPAIEKLL